MSGRDWTKAAQRERIARNGTEDVAGATVSKFAPGTLKTRRPMSKEELRREADRLIAAGAVQVKRVPPGRSSLSSDDSERKKVSPRNSAPASGERPQMDRAVPAGLVIYADGCCEPNPGAGGWGFAVYRDGVEISRECGGDPKATNQRMELTAAIEALNWANRNIADQPFRLISDSQYTVKGSNEWRHGWKAKGWRRKGDGATAANQAIANLDLWQELDRMLTTIPVTLEWCKGHAGIVGNEIADQLSFEGRRRALPASPRDLIAQQLRYEVL